MNHIKLADLAHIQTGYTFRSGLAHTDLGVPVVQLKDIQLDGSINLKSLSQSVDEGFKESHTLKEGDLIFRSRGQFLSMGVVPSFDSRLILSSPLVRVSVDFTRILPEYLAWYVNGPLGQMYLESLAEGSSVKMLSKTSLSEMPIPLPKLDIQRTIADITLLSAKEKQLNDLLYQKRQQLINTRIQHYLQEKIK